MRRAEGESSAEAKSTEQKTHALALGRPLSFASNEIVAVGTYEFMRGVFGLVQDLAVLGLDVYVGSAVLLKECRDKDFVAPQFMLDARNRLVATCQGVKGLVSEAVTIKCGTGRSGSFTSRREVCQPRKKSETTTARSSCRTDHASSRRGGDTLYPKLASADASRGGSGATEDRARSSAS